MAKREKGIAIYIKGFLPHGDSVDEQLDALTLVKRAHESGDYSAVLAKSKIDEVKTTPTTRVADDTPAAAA